MTSEPIMAVSQFPWGNLITAGAALGGTFAGSVLTYIFGKKNWERQIGYEKEKEDLKILREKSEELLVTVTTWVRYSLAIHQYQKYTSQGDLTYRKYMEFVKDRELEAGTYDRVEALISLYFPELMPHLEMISKISQQTYVKFDNVYGNITPDFLMKHAVHDIIVESIGMIKAELDKIKLGIRNTAIL